MFAAEHFLPLQSLDLLWAAAGNHQTLHQGHRGLNTQSSAGSPVVTMG